VLNEVPQSESIHYLTKHHAMKTNMGVEL